MTSAIEWPRHMSSRMVRLMKLGGRTIKWDPKAEKVIGDPEAQALCGIKFRDPWKL